MFSVSPHSSHLWSIRQMGDLDRVREIQQRISMHRSITPQVFDVLKQQLGTFFRNPMGWFRGATNVSMDKITLDDGEVDKVTHCCVLHNSSKMYLNPITVIGYSVLPSYTDNFIAGLDCITRGKSDTNYSDPVVGRVLQQTIHGLTIGVVENSINISFNILARSCYAEGEIS